MKIYLPVFLILLCCNCCSNKTLTEPGILLTFDDRNITSWEKQIPLFEKYDAQVTFFIDHFDKLTPLQLESLHKLKNAGHAIGCHGLRHAKATDYCDKNSLQKYISDEIEPAIKIMHEKGFQPSCFAYPNSASNETIDRELLKYFRHLRSGSPVEGVIEKTEKAFLRIDDLQGKGKLDGISFHPKSEDDVLVIQAKDAVKRITENRELLVLYAHDIRFPEEEGPKNFITPDALEEILAYAKANKIKLYSFDELP